MKQPVIYKIRNVVNDDFYVGSTLDTRSRFKVHRNRLRRGIHHSKQLQAAWDKHGEDCFKFEIVETVKYPALLQSAEDAWLKEHVGKTYCYNTSLFSDAPWRGCKPENNPLTGKPKSDTTKAAISDSLKETYAGKPENHPRFGATLSAESRAKISESRKGKAAGAEHYRYGKTVSAEVRKKIGDAQRGVKKGSRVLTPEGLAVMRASMAKVNAEHPSVKKELEVVLAKFPDVVRQKYDFSKAVYTGALKRITGLVCPQHGEFSQYAAQLRKDRGCPACGAAVRGLKKKQSLKKLWEDPAWRERTKAAQSIGKKKVHAKPDSTTGLTETQLQVLKDLASH